MSNKYCPILIVYSQKIAKLTYSNLIISPSLVFNALKTEGSVFNHPENKDPDLTLQKLLLSLT